MTGAGVAVAGIGAGETAVFAVWGVPQTVSPNWAAEEGKLVRNGGRDGVADPGLESSLGVVAVGGVYGAVEYLASLMMEGALKTLDSTLRMMFGVP